MYSRYLINVSLIFLVLSMAPGAQAQPAEGFGAPDSQEATLPLESVDEAARSLSPEDILFRAVTQRKEGPRYYLRGNVQIITSSMLLEADEVDYDESTEYAEARGNVYFRNLTGGEELWCRRAEYHLGTETGKFYEVRGTAMGKVDVQPGILHTENPVQFEGVWAEKRREKYILYDGYLTNCDLESPWWKLEGPRFDIIPGDRAISSRSRLLLKGVPIFYSPYFYKSLKREPRRSGFLTPNIGNSSRLGRMVGAGYYWAPSRSYDATYRSQLFTQRGFAHLADVRGKPREGTDFDMNLYGVNDRGLRLDSGERRKEGGAFLTFRGRSQLGRGWRARGELNILSSFRFRQAFTQTFNEAVYSQVNSIGFATRQWDNMSMDVVFTRQENFQSVIEGDRVLIRKMPQLEFATRDRKVWDKVLPVWVSLDSSAGLMRRKQPLFETRQFSQRLDLQPRVMSAFHLKGFHFVPSFALRETYYGQSRAEEGVRGQNLLRNSHELSLEIVPPSFAKVMESPAWMGEKLKHVIEPRMHFRRTRGIDNFDDLVRFDETELLTNTSEAEVSLSNRLFARRAGATVEVLSWQLWQRRYFDEDFGGAVQPGLRNVIQSSASLTGFAFLDGARRYSPLVSAMRLSPTPWLGVEWRSDYDSRRSRIVNNAITADFRRSGYYVSLGHNQVRSAPIQALGENQFLGLSPNANQFRGLLVVGDQNRRGWNAAFSSIYDVRQSQMQFATTQITYNTDCCGFSVQYRRFSFGTRNENQIRFAFAIANIGSFGTLSKQERLF